MSRKILQTATAMAHRAGAATSCSRWEQKPQPARQQRWPSELKHQHCAPSGNRSLGLPGRSGDCDLRVPEPFTVIVLLGIIAIPILILALCFAICCICNRERLHHQALIKSLESCLNPLTITCASEPLHSPCPQTDRYQEKYENIDCEHPVECENMDFLLCTTRNDPSQYYPELNELTRRSVVENQEPKIAEGNKKNSPMLINRRSPGSLPKFARNSVSLPFIPFLSESKTVLACLQRSHALPAATHASFEENQQTKASERNSSTLITSQSPCLENEQAKVEEESGRISSSNIVSQDPCPVAARSSVVKGGRTEAAEQERKTCTSSPKSQSPCPAYEFNCLEGGTHYPFEGSEGTTCSIESCDQMIMEKFDAECQVSYPASRESSEDCNNNSIASCLDKVVQTSSVFQSKSQEILPCNNSSDITSSSQSSYREYLSTLSIDVSTPRSESSSQTSSSSDVADEFGNKSRCSLNSLKSREALLNFMQSYFPNEDDVKSMKISVLMDKSQADVLSNCTNLKESMSRISHQMSSPSTSQEYSQKALKNKCCFQDHKSIFTDLETSLTSVENSERNPSGLDSPEIDLLIPTTMIGSSDWYCVEDNEPCSKTTTVRYMFTDSETDG
ncbi:serine-rich adhesin for platelets-like isoform X10 [Narcine bancroftii]|uniref:serine-rich adhesin for platelets-like isoform X10 n=1 Tax=Narcine bancroftii TaxID=1343680 RepID=UPI0038310F4D